MSTIITFMLSHVFHPMVAPKLTFCLIIITMMIIMNKSHDSNKNDIIIMITMIMIILMTYRMKSIKRLS